MTPRPVARQPPAFAAGWFFVAPSTDFYNFALDKVPAATPSF